MTEKSDDHPPKTYRHSDTTKQLIGDGNRGKKMPVDSVIKMRDRVRANHPRPMLGKRHSEEALQKMRNAAALRKVDPEKDEKRRAAVSAATKGKPKSLEHRAKISAGVSAYISSEGYMATYTGTTGEQDVAKFLEARELNYEQQATIGNNPHPYDFAVHDLSIIIEFDGAHHWHKPWFESDETKHPQLLVEQFLKDTSQTMQAEQAGWRVARIRGHNRPGDSSHGTLEEQLLAQGFSDLVNYQKPFGGLIEAIFGKR